VVASAGGEAAVVGHERVDEAVRDSESAVARWMASSVATAGGEGGGGIQHRVVKP
jgi:hypothetical protein